MELPDGRLGHLTMGGVGWGVDCVGVGHQRLVVFGFLSAVLCCFHVARWKLGMLPDVEFAIL